MKYKHFFQNAIIETFESFDSNIIKIIFNFFFFFNSQEGQTILKQSVIYGLCQGLGLGIILLGIFLYPKFIKWARIKP